MNAKIRSDLVDYKIPAIEIQTGIERFIELNETITCLQPDELDNDEYNVVVPDLGIKLCSIDLDFF